MNTIILVYMYTAYAWSECSIWMIANPSQLKWIKFSKETYITVILNGKEFEKNKRKEEENRVWRKTVIRVCKGVLDQTHNPNLKWPA